MPPRLWPTSTTGSGWAATSAAIWSAHASSVTSANLAFLGSLVGTGLGVALAETAPPSPGALSLGVAAGLGVGVGVGALLRSYRFTDENAFAAGLVAGSLAASVATLVAGPADVGLFPVMGATLGGLATAGLSTVVVAAV